MSQLNQSTQTLQHKIPRQCDRDPRHTRAAVRHVERLDGPARDLCRACWRYACAIEAHAKLVSRWHGLFRSLCPRLNRAGGIIEALASRIVDYLLARALLAAYRDRSHRPFIALARVAARIAERGAI